MIDSGAAGNFIDIRFAKTPNLPLVPCESRVAVAALDGRPLGTVQVKFITKICVSELAYFTQRQFAYSP